MSSGARVETGEQEHLFWPGQTGSLCGQEARDLPQFSAQRDYVPRTVHYTRVCEACLEVAEIGPQDKGGNRIVPMVSGYVVSEREKPRTTR